MDYLLLTEAVVTLLVMINPFSVIPPYLSLTQDLDPDERRRILRQAMVFAFFILVGCILAGQAILKGLGISTFALQIAGGILFFKFGYEVMNGGLKTEADQAPGLVPLGFPIIAGPGSITAIILLGSKHDANLHLLLAVMVVLLVTFISLYYARTIVRVLGDDATTAIVKLMGLLVLTIGIQLVLTGLQLWINSMELIILP